MTGRDVIAAWIGDYTNAEYRAHKLVQDLTAAGYRLIGPGELDRETIERCAAECDRIDNECGMEAGLAAACSEAIRALQSQETPDDQ